MKRVCALIFVTLVNCVVGDEKPQVQQQVPEVTIEKPMSFWMAQKIDHSKKILEALTKEDFKQIELEANQLRLLGKIEIFVRRKDAAYLRHQQSFDSSLLDMATQARAQNVEGATLAFNQLTTSCVVCHKILRANEPAQQAPASVPSAATETLK